MNAATVERDQLMPQPLPGRRTGLILALLAHGLLIAALTLALNWRVSTPTATEAELWDELPRTAAPKAVEPPAETPPPRPATKVEPPPPRPTPSRATEDAQIAIEKARLAKERAEKERNEREEKERQREQARKEVEKAAAKKAADEKAAADKAAKDKAAKDKAAEEQRKAQEEQARTKAARDAQLRRIQGLAGGTGGPESRGSSEHSAGLTPSYVGRINARVKPNIILTDTIEGNPLAEVEVRLSPEGRILGQKLVRSSGVKAWDDAVQRAIDRTEILPRREDGTIPNSMVLSFRPKD